MGQSQLARRRNDSSMKESEQVNQGGVEEGPESCQRTASLGPFITATLPLRFLVYTHIYTYAYKCVHMCAYINIIVIILCLIKLNSIVNIDHILCPIPVTASFPLPSPT